MKVGCPQKTLADLPKNWQKLILEYSRAGGGVVGCITRLKIGRDLWYSFIERFPEFKTVILECRLNSQAWWEDRMMESATGDDDGKSNATMMIWNMKNRFPDDWQDRKIVEQTVTTIEKTDDEIDKEIADLQSSHDE